MYHIPWANASGMRARHNGSAGLQLVPKPTTSRPVSHFADFLWPAMLVPSPYARCISLQERAVLMPGTMVGCLALLAVMSTVGIVRLAAPPKRSAAWNDEARPQRPLSPAERRRWRIGWVLSTLPLFGLAVTEWRYLRTDGRVSVPASAPLLDRMIWILTVVGILGEFAGICVYATRQAREAHSRPRDSTGA